MAFSIRRYEDNDWTAVQRVYAQGIEGRNATFETTVPDRETWQRRFHPHLLWVAVMDRLIVGWAGLQPVSARKVYNGVAEVTVYVERDNGGKGIGKALMVHLVTESEKAGVWTLHASIFPENAASIRLHIGAGFREIGYRERIAQLDGIWRDTKLFERRSNKVGL
jgi:L-amino acid N-acyltransferase YncA